MSCAELVSGQGSCHLCVWAFQSAGGHGRDLDLSELHPDFDRHGRAGIPRSEIYVHDDAGAMTRSIQGWA